MSKRVDSASRTILATPRAIFRAFIDPEVISRWRPPTGMTAEIYSYDPRQGGGYHMAFVYENSDTPGKTGANRDAFVGRFIELVPDSRIVEEIDFDTVNPAFAGTMRIVTQLTPVSDGTKVTVSAEDVPTGISADHRKGMASSLRNLAMLLE